MKSLLSCGFALGTLLIANTAPAQKSDHLSGLKAADAEITKAVIDRDLERIVAFYADDAILLPAAEPTVMGKAAIRAEWQHILAIPDLGNASTLVSAETSAAGDFGYTTGTYLSRMRGENGEMVSEPGKWVSIWKRQPDGTWRIVVETYNTDIPPPDHK